MAAIAKENLDERIERIKKRNEEIEKKYREAEEDRLMALKENAMVETKSPKDEDWPRSHKYDKIDFTYDVKPEKLEELNKIKKTEEPKQKRDYKKFAEGEGPPPDPAYNFLADAERDGTHPGKDGKTADKKDSRQNNTKNKEQQQKRGGPNTGSFRGRGGKAHSPKYQKQNSQPEYEQWRNEREKIDEARINRQKVGEGKWKREWDNEKINSENEALLRPERTTLGDVFHAAKKSPTHNNNNNNKNQNAGHNYNPDCLVEKRGNITVSVSQTGEVKSVKLTSAPVIGTGRVGPRQVGKPQFSIQSIEKEVITPALVSPQPQKKPFIKSNNNNNNNKPITRSQNTPTSPINLGKNTKQRNKPQSPKYVQPQQGVVVQPPFIPVPLIADLPPESANELVAVDLSHKPEFAKKSVQERLLRVRQPSGNTQQTTCDDLNATSTNINEVTSSDDPKTNCDKTNESIQTAEPIAACN